MNEARNPSRSETNPASPAAARDADITQALPGRRGESELLKAEWENRFTPEAFQNPLFAEAFEDALRKRDGIRLFEIIQLQAGASGGAGDARPFSDRYRESVKAIGSKGPGATGLVPVGLFDYVSLALTAAEGEASRRRKIDWSTIDAILKLGSELLEDPALSGFRGDILEGFTSSVTPPLSVLLAPARPPAPPKPPVRIELEAFVGKIFRGYRIIAVLGRGGFGAVFLAEHPTLPLKRALKLFLDVDRSGPAFEKFREKCFDEARLQSGLNHENILEVVDAFEDQGYVVLVMEYVDGPNLARLIQEKMRARARFQPIEVLDLAIPVARGLLHAHKHGVVHRDMKPENILLDKGRPKIADFGLARHLEETGQRHATAGHLVGTPLYMAPEQIAAKAKTYGPACDIYSFGVVLYQMCLGITPFDHEDRFKILEQHELEAPDPITHAIEDFPEELDRIIQTCLKKRPEDRFRSAEELLGALERCKSNLAGGQLVASKQPWERRHASRRRRMLAIAGTALLLILCAFTAFPALSRWFRAREPKQGLIDGVDPISLLPAHKDPLPVAKESDHPTAAPPKPEEPTPARTEVKKSEGITRDKPVPPEPKQSLPLRQLLAGYPVGSDDALLISQIMDLFTKHRRDLLARRYEAIETEVSALAPQKKNDYTVYHVEAAQDLVRLARDLVRDRWRELGESKNELRLRLVDGRTAQGTVDRVDDRMMTLADAQGSKTGVEIANVAPEEFLRGRTVAAAEIAYQALSGDAGKALGEAIQLEKTRDKVAVWYPILVRLARLQACEELQGALALAEPRLGRREKRASFLGLIPRYSEALATLQALADAEATISPIYPALSREFALAKREGEATDAVLSGEYSRALGRYEGTEACPLAATLLLAGFLGDLEQNHDDLIGKAGFLNWELRPDEASGKERTQYWDLLEDDGFVLRDAKGPRRLILGRPHPRVQEGLVIRYEFESLGEESAKAEWGITLRKEGGGYRYLRFGPGSISLHAFTLEGGVSGDPLASVKTVQTESEPRTHTCVLIPGEYLHVFVDGRIVANLPKEDTLLPSQPSVAVVHGKLSLRSMWVKKKPGK